MNNHKHRSRGFTIVELLIVVVVIVILAAITLVLLTGSQRRAREGLSSDAAAKARDKLILYQFDNQGYPVTGNLAAAGITNGNGVLYQYTSDGTTYCLSASAGSSGVSYMVTDSQPITSGVCSGHSTTGFVAVTNLLTNPSAASTANYAMFDVAPGALTLNTDSSSFSGGSYLRRSVCCSGGNPNSAGVTLTSRPPVTAGSDYTFSIYSRGSIGFTARLRIVWVDGAGTTIGTKQASVPIATSWTKATATGTAPAGAVSADFFIGTISSALYTGDYLDVDAAMFTQSSSAYNYADGSSSGWTWSGTANASTSSGPAL